MTEIQKRQRQLKVINTVMKMMVEEKFTVGEAETLPEALSEELRKNSERFEKEKPFAIYEKNSDSVTRQIQERFQEHLSKDPDYTEWIR